MPKNGGKTGKSSKTARVLSLLTDPAASLLGGSRNHKDEGQDDATELTEAPRARGLDDAATESRIQASLAAEEDSLVTELFGNKAPSRPQRTEEPTELVEPTGDNSSETSYLVPPTPPRNAAPQASGQDPQDAQEPDPQTLELLSMLSNPSTLGNSAMPTFADEPQRPAAFDMDFADELTAGLPEQPAPEPEPERPEPAAQPTPPPVQQAASQPTPPPVRQPAQPAAPVQRAAQPTPPPVRQPTPPPVQQAAPQPVQQAPQHAPQTATAHDYEEFVCFNLTQALVEDKAEKLMRQFGMCTCNRCKVDVTAIALSNLPAKYVAMQNRDILPLLSMYEEKYSAAVTVQVMSACRMVMKRPHHGR